MSAQLHLGDCLEVLATLAPNSIDACVTDPPYELGFMGKDWDKSGVAYKKETWAAVLRVLKPGAHLLAFGGTRTYHRMVCAIEDAGFEIRDQIGWVYGSGFPKSLNIAKAIDANEKTGSSRPEDLRRVAMGEAYEPSMRGRVNYDHGSASVMNGATETCVTGDAAKQWDGWGTALKPAWEPIVLARKPINGTVAENVLAHGAGGLNINGCRVPANDERSGGFGNGNRPWVNGCVGANTVKVGSNVGRWPANIIHDGSDEVISAFPSAPGQQGVSIEDGEDQGNNIYGKMKRGGPNHIPREESNKSAARFFYCAKASKSDREEGCEHLPENSPAENTDREPDSDGLNSPRAGAGRTSSRKNNHPTVKPTALMRYLCRMVTPPDGSILDPFTGSGSTGKAALLEGFNFIGIEREEAYYKIARARLGLPAPCLIEDFD